jgi:hypothetical protein
LHVRRLYLQVSEARTDLLTMRIGVMEGLRDDHGRVALVLSFVQQKQALRVNRLGKELFP